MDNLDQLELELRSSLTGAVGEAQVRILRDTPSLNEYEDIELKLTPTADRAKYNTSQGTGTGWIVGAEIFNASDDAKRGQLYANLSVRRKGRHRVNLCKGYIANGLTVALGEFVEPGPGGGEGAPIGVALAADQAASWDVTVPAGAIRILRAACATFTTSAVAANRNHRLLAYQSNGAVDVDLFEEYGASGTAMFNQPASTTYHFRTNPDTATPTPASATLGNVVAARFPRNVLLEAGAVVSLWLENAQAGDIIKATVGSATGMWFEEWLIP